MQKKEEKEEIANQTAGENQRRRKTLESVRNFNQQMSQVTWECPWKSRGTIDEGLERHSCREGATVFACERCVFAVHLLHWYHFDRIGSDALAASGIALEPQDAA